MEVKESMVYVHLSLSLSDEICLIVVDRISPKIMHFIETKAIETVLDWGTLMAESMD